jgi:Carboxypeptidase regulatory-like domain/TonB-dependent Receptor Plug Domain
MYPRRCVFLFALPFLYQTLFGQVATGTITGIVSDASGAIVPGAVVKIVDEGTNSERSLATDNTGNYVAARLLPGKYRVEVNLPGFQSQAKVGLVLSIDQTMRVDFTLQPGEQRQVVTVVARAEQLVEASTSSLGEVIEETLIKELPLNGRDFRQLIGLTAGAQPAPLGGFAAGTFNINGTRGEGNAFLVDGIDVSSYSSGDTIRVVPSLEALGEFKIITNNFSAEYGRSFSGVVSVHVKSGTNAFHGSLFHFLRKPRA